MIETVGLTLGFLGLLAYIYFHEKEERKLRDADLTRIQKLMGESFKDFLKHIEKLERMTLPKPVTTKDVQSVMSRIGTMADESLEIENDIENEVNKGIQMPSDEWTGYINADTKVAFEDEEPGAVVE